MVLCSIALFLIFLASITALEKKSGAQWWGWDDIGLNLLMEFSAAPNMSVFECLGWTLFDAKNNDWDPLPAGLRNVVSSNHLGEAVPQIFAEYHALLPNFRGDYGVKSELVDSASKDPIYQGVDTLLLPLYIPQGAVPITLNNRRIRSGKADVLANVRILRGPIPAIRDSAVSSSINRPLRRVISQRRRPVVSTKPLPTPPPSYLRTWIKRKHDATSTVTTENLDVKNKTTSPTLEEKGTKLKLLTHLVNFKKKMGNVDSNNKKTEIHRDAVVSNESTLQNVSNKSNTLSQSIISNKRRKEIVRINKINSAISNLTSKAGTSVSRPIPEAKTRVIGTNLGRHKSNSHLKLSKDSHKLTPNTLENIINSSSNESLSNDIATSKIKLTTETSLTFGLKTRTEKILPSSTIKATTLFTASKSSVIIVPVKFNDRPRKKMKPVVPTRSSAEIDFDKKQDSSVSERNNRISGSTHTNSTIVPKFKPKVRTAKEKLKTPEWLKRRRIILNRDIQLGSKFFKSKSNKSITESIIDRVLNSAVKLSVSKNATLNNSAILPTNSTTFNSINSEESKDFFNKSDSKENDKSSDSNSKNPARPHSRKASLASNEKDYFTNFTVVLRDVTNGVTMNEEEHTQSRNKINNTTDLASNTVSRNKVPLKSRYHIVSNPVKATTPSRITTFAVLNTFPKVNSTRSHFNGPLVRTIHTTQNDDISSSLKLNDSTYATSTITTVTEPTSRKVSFSYSGSPIRRNPAVTLRPLIKSAQDIVLEKLEKLMRNATAGGRSNVELIVREIEILNKELAYMGIHIIDAEFAGQKIKLKNQGYIRRRNNRPRTSTVRYLVPNSKGSFTDSFVNRNRNNFTRFTQNSKRLNALKNFSRNAENFSKLSPSSPNSKVAVTTAKKFKPNVDRKEEFVTKFTKVYESYTTSPDIETDNEVTDVKYEKSKIELSTLGTIKEDENTIRNFKSNNWYIRSIPTSHLRPVKYDKPLKHDNSDSNDVVNTFKYSHVNTEKPKNQTASKIIPDKKNLTLENSTGNKEEQESVLETDDDESSGYIYFVSVLGLVPCAAGLFYLYKQRRRKKQKSLPEREERVDCFTPSLTHSDKFSSHDTLPQNIRNIGHTDTLDAFPGYIFETGKRESPWELPRSKLKITSVIGEGNFGIVWKAEARNLCDWEERGGPTVLVAVKGVKEDAGNKEKSDLLREISIMQHLGQHPNIVTLLGCCTVNEPYFLVLEYVMFGKLLTFLREQRSKNNYYTFSSDSEHLTSKDLTRFACQIVSGCEYLQSRGVIHRDLAARNILVDHKKVCKIADFGLARSVKDTDTDIYEQKSRGPLPIRWMASESLFMNIFTPKSDVWSFGVLCWEIFTLGSTPYPGLSAREVMRRVREGYRLERPEHCRPELYKVVSQCWKQDRAKRPSFSVLGQELRQVMKNQPEAIDLENFQEQIYFSMHQNNEEKL